MPLSWNEIKQRAVKFSKDWENATEESAESQTFLNEFFEVFGISRRRVSTFEKPVKKLDGREGYIDLLWPGKILIEHKSKGKSLEKARVPLELGKAVDLCYRLQPFPNETKRIEFLFELYEKYTQPLMAKTKSKKK